MVGAICIWHPYNNFGAHVWHGGRRAQHYATLSRSRNGSSSNRRHYRSRILQQWAASNLGGTPLYYKDALRRWPERHAAAISAVAWARPGGVLFHCVRGNDRTGIIALLLLALAGVALDDILADYELSRPDPERDELLAREHSSVRDAILGALAGLNIDSYLLMGGASQDDLAAVRKRLLG